MAKGLLTIPITRRAVLALIGGALGLGAVGPPLALAAPPRGDIPDSAVFLRYDAPHYRIEYIEGWVRQTRGSIVTFSEKDSAEALALRPAPHGTLAAAVRGPEISALRHAGASHLRGPQAISLPGGHGWYLQYVAPSTPDPVTGKVVQLLTDRYYIPGTTMVAVLTLSAPVGDDNVDAFRRIAHSFRWR